MKTIVISADNAVPVERKEMTFEEIQRAVKGPDQDKGFVQSVSFPRNIANLLCNEDGKHLNLPYNERATALASLLGVGLATDDCLVGTVCIVGPIRRDEFSDAPDLIMNSSVLS